MALKKTPDSAETLSREALWGRRLAEETRCLQACLVDGRPAPYAESLRVVFAKKLLGMAGLLDRGAANANRPVLREHAFTFEALPPAFDGFRILHLSDFHFNDRPGFVDAICALLTGVEADLCVLTGDYRFNRHAPCRSVYRGMERILSLIRPSHGVIGILGNNDMSDFADGFRALGIRMLINDSVRIDRDADSLWFAGVDDPHEFRCASLPLAVRDIPEGAFTILLAHSPEVIPEAAAAGIDLYLCGHTHGGQVCLPNMGPIYLNCRAPRRYCGGPWQYEALQGYTTRGLGTSTLAVRFNCPPEATLIRLKWQR